MNDRSLDDWLDGRLSGPDHGAFQARLRDDAGLAAELALQRRLDASLARSFPVPTSVPLDLAPAPLRPHGGGELGRFPWPVLAAAGVAAALLLATLLGEHRRPDADVPDERLAGADPAAALICEPLAAGPSIGAPDICIAVPGPARSTPDLAALYRQFANYETIPACTTPEELAGKIARAYGCCTELALEPEAANMLQGPYSSKDWPTGTILTGRAEGGTSVLIAELGSNLECCLDPSLAEDSGLNVYTWKVSELVLTEITPHDEPQLLGFFTLD